MLVFVKSRFSKLSRMLSFCSNQKAMLLDLKGKGDSKKLDSSHHETLRLSLIQELPSSSLLGVAHEAKKSGTVESWSLVFSRARSIRLYNYAAYTAYVAYRVLGTVGAVDVVVCVVCICSYPKLRELRKYLHHHIPENTIIFWVFDPTCCMFSLPPLLLIGLRLLLLLLLLLLLRFLLLLLLHLCLSLSPLLPADMKDPSFSLFAPTSRALLRLSRAVRSTIFLLDSLTSKTPGTNQGLCQLRKLSPSIQTLQLSSNTSFVIVREDPLNPIPKP